ncbi:MAG: Yip1 family protein, partial [Inhella sp.]
MNFIQRVQDILLKPKETWPSIASEPASVASIYQQWLFILAAIPAVAGFIGMSVLGFGGFGFRVPLLTGLVQMILSYALSLGMVYLMAHLVDALAPSFGGTKNFISAFKLMAYSLTAAFVGGIFSLIPALAVLGLVAAAYSIYLLYTGLPELMRNPPDKSAAYTAVVVVAGIVAGIVVGAITAAITPSFGMMGHRAGANVTLNTPDGEVTLNTAKLEEMAKRMEEAGKRAEAAQKSGDPDAAGKALGDMMGAMSGGKGQPIAAAELKAFLPESLGELKRVGIEAQSGGAMGINVSTAKAQYTAGEKRIELSIADTGGLAGLAAMAGWANLTVDRETETDVEKVYKQGNRTVREEYRKDGSNSERSVVLANGLVIEAQGRSVDPALLKQATEAVALTQLEALQRPRSEGK